MLRRSLTCLRDFVLLARVAAKVAPCFGSNLSSRFRRLISPSKRARGAFCAAALNPECWRAVRITVCKFVVPFSNVRTVRRCCCPPCYIKRYSTALCFAFIHTWDASSRARGKKGLSLATTLCHSLFSLHSTFLIREDSPSARSCCFSFSPFHFLSLSLLRTCASFCLFSRIFRPFSLPPPFRLCGSDA